LIRQAKVNPKVLSVIDGAAALRLRNMATKLVIIRVHGAWGHEATGSRLQDAGDFQPPVVPEF